MTNTTCLKCGETYTRDDRREMREMGEEFYHVGDRFICPDCWDSLRQMDLEDILDWLLSKVGDEE